ncbi:MAG: imidazole glycerol phosphate synthase subunit HisF [Bacteroidales bacterium]|nr:imidazole glycerol phosphate synthase subunit HisF [Bacteroidales bacterium]
MVAKRIIPCLDVLDGITVKGVNFINIIEIGDPVEMGRFYAEEGADELVYLDINASYEGRGAFHNLVSRIASGINIPFTVGGGITSLEEASALLDFGADKVSINTSALENPGLIDKIAAKYGSQFIVVAIDAVEESGQWRVLKKGGRYDAKRELFEWAKEACERGAGEILFTSVGNDGTRDGFACNTIAKLSRGLPVPVIASGGAGCKEDFADVFSDGYADAALAASVFHNGDISINLLKRWLNEKNINVRI